MILSGTLKTFPLQQLDLEEAIKSQFRLLDCVHHHFDGFEIVQDGDYGHNHEPELDRPMYTAKVEETLAEFFGSPEVALVRGAGTGGIRACLMAGLRGGQTVLLHDAPAYPTTGASLEFLSLRAITVDMNRIDALARITREAKPDGAVVQHTRNKIDDSYDLSEVLRVIKRESPNTLIVVDDNYATMRVPKIGSELGADFSAFSFFKLLGPAGLGCVVAGTERGQRIMGDIRRMHRSGGFRVQGPEAMDTLRALTLAPVALAVQAQVVHAVAERLNAGEVPGVRSAYVASTNSLCVIVELAQPVAQRVLEITPRLGAQRQSVGSESRVEISALFHEAFPYFSPTAFPWLAENRERLIRINPYRTGPDTIIRVLREALAQVER